MSTAATVNTEQCHLVPDFKAVFGKDRRVKTNIHYGCRTTGVTAVESLQPLTRVVMGRKI